MFGRMRPRLTKFGMQLSNGIIYAYIIRIFEFHIFGRFFGGRLVFWVHDIYGRIRPRLTKFGISFLM